MTRALPLAVLFLLGGAPAFAQVSGAPVPIALPHPPPITNQTSRVLFDAMLAISRAQQVNPHAAQSAAFDYTAALQQYRIGNVNAARVSALRALSTASQPNLEPAVASPLPTPALVPAAPQIPGLAGGLYGGDAPAIDADTFLALARGTLATCAARHDPNSRRAQERYSQALKDFAQRDWQATRVDAKAAIDLCAKPQ